MYKLTLCKTGKRSILILANLVNLFLSQLLKLYLQILFGVGVVRNYEVGTDNIEKSEEKNEGEVEKLHISNE